MIRWLRAGALLALTLACGLTQAQPATVRIEHFDLALQPSLHSLSFSGRLELRLRALADAPATLRLDAGSLEMVSAQTGSQPLHFEQGAPP